MIMVQVVDATGGATERRGSLVRDRAAGRALHGRHAPDANKPARGSPGRHIDVAQNPLVSTANTET